MRHLTTLCFALLLTTGCDREITVNLPTDPTPVPIITHSFEYRVTGNAQQVRIRYSNPVDGTAQVTSALPFFTSFRSDRDFMFLSIDATPLNFPFSVTQPFVAAQILVDGVLFAQASSTEFLETVSVSGTWRR